MNRNIFNTGIGRKTLFLIPIVALSFSSCLKELDNKRDETNVTEAVFWKTEAHLIAGANYLYTFLPGIGQNNDNNWSDDARSTGSNSISDGSRMVPSGTSDYDGNYNIIRAANNIMEKAAEMTIAEPIKQRYIAEARFFRAFAYFEMLKRFGGVPLIDRTLAIGDPLLDAPRAEREEIAQFIYDDLDFAIQHLPASRNLPTAQYGRITRGAAQAFKIRAALFEGTFRKYHQLGNAEASLNEVIRLAEEMISENDYALYNYAADPAQSYYQLFQAVANGAANKETILPRLYGESMENTIASHSYSRNLEQGSTTPTRYLVDAYLYIDGLPRTGPQRSPLYQPDVNTISEFENRDPRLSMTVFKTGDLYYNGGRYIPSFSFTQTGYKTFKGFNALDWMNQRSFTHHKIIRYAEVLLSYAEAMIEVKGGITDDQLNQSVNIVRQRAGMPKLSNAFAQTHQLQLLDEIRRERRVEFALEGGHRYWDIIRWKIAEQVLPLPTLGIRYFRADYPQPLDRPNLNPEGYIIAQTAATRKFNPDRDYLWPLPITQLSLNPNLKQNPGWVN